MATRKRVKPVVVAIVIVLVVVISIGLVWFLTRPKATKLVPGEPVGPGAMIGQPGAVGGALPERRPPVSEESTTTPKGVTPR